MLRNGMLWLEPNGRLSCVNYESKVEHNQRLSLIEKEKGRLHESIRDFIEPLFVWETQKFRIRVDRTGTNEFRYASWTIDKDQSTKPDLILFSKELVFTGSGGNHQYMFKNGAYEYKCRVVVLGNLGNSPGFLIVSKNGKEILNEKVIKNVRN